MAAALAAGAVVPLVTSRVRSMMDCGRPSGSSAVMASSGGVPTAAEARSAPSGSMAALCTE